MKLAVIVLLRNEADIFPAFAQHLAALFDVALLMDHSSTDGTAEMIAAACEAQPAWTWWRIAIPGFHQSLFTAFALRHVFATTEADAVFFLDADEFIDVANRGALEAMLASCTADRTLPVLRWHNAIPRNLDEITGIGAGLLAAPATSPFEKIAVPRAVFEATGGGLTPLAGNHVADPGDGAALQTAFIGEILHVPLRSVLQMTRKTIVGALAHLARTNRPVHEGSHRFDALARLVEGGFDEAVLRGWASAYGEPGAAALAYTEDEMLRRGFTVRALDVAHAGLRFPLPAYPPQTLAQAIAAALQDWQPAADGELSLSLDGNVLRADPLQPREDRLPAAIAARDAALSEIAALRASTSWRLTAPLRAAIQALRGATPR